VVQVLHVLGPFQLGLPKQSFKFGVLVWALLLVVVAAEHLFLQLAVMLK
jgi:hypothetical protein